jgi:hypothetical protein
MIAEQTAFQRRNVNGCARRFTRVKDEVAPDMVTMQIVVCDQCGLRFGIGHRYDAQDDALATLQATWLMQQFTWDHIREAKHHNSIPLPAACAIEDAPTHRKERHA